LARRGKGDLYQAGRNKQLVSATLYAEDGDTDICILDANGITGKPILLVKAAVLKVGNTFMLWEPQEV
jgi:hypothetical protein